MKSHVEGKVLCFECVKYCVTARDLKEHIAIEHERIRKFKWTVCGKAFAKECGLQVHSVQCDTWFSSWTFPMHVIKLNAYKQHIANKLNS